MKRSLYTCFMTIKKETYSCSERNTVVELKHLDHGAMPGKNYQKTLSCP